MDIDDTNGDDSNESSSAASSSSSSSSSSVVLVYQALESTESGKASVQPRIDIPLTVEESTRMLRFKKELIATILDAVVFQRAGT